MPVNTDEDLLRLQTPETGRKYKEDATVVNVADTEFARSLLEPSTIALRKQGFFFQHLREGIPNNDEYYYRLKAPATKHAVIYTRELAAGEGPVRFETVINPSSYSAGTIVPSVNLYTGGPSAETVVEAGVVPVGGITIPADYLFGTGNKQGTAGSGAGIPTIIPPNVEIFAKFTNEATGTNPAIRFALAFAEIEIPDILVI